MKSVKSNVRSEAIFSEDDNHRLSLKKVWNQKLSNVMVIMKYPRFEGSVKMDLSSQLVVNQSVELGYGGVYLSNLFTNVNINDATEELEELVHESSDEYLLKAAEDSEVIIFAWGSSTSKITNNRIKEVTELLKDYEDKIHILMNPTTKEIAHPLNPKSRLFWMIEKIKNRQEQK